LAGVGADGEPGADRGAEVRFLLWLVLRS